MERDQFIKEIIDLLKTQEEVPILICGSRGFVQRHLIVDVLVSILTQVSVEDGAKLVIIEGGAQGADRSARDSAEILGLRCRTYPADWKTLGNAAGYIRNKEMVDVSLGTFAHWDGVSKGTKHSIDLSIKKGIPLMVKDDDFLGGETNPTKVIQLIVKHHLMNSLAFSIEDSAQSAMYLNEVSKYDGDDIVGFVRDLQKTCDVIPEYLNGVDLTYLLPRLDGNVITDRTLSVVNEMVLTIRDIITPKVTNLIYVKLDTGGFSGYNRFIRCRGEEHYPVLRITMKVNDKEPLDIFINPQDKEANIDKRARAIHVDSGLLVKACSSDINIDAAKRMVVEYLKEHNVLQTNPSDNVHTHLVGYNTDFIRAFLKENFSEILSLCSPRDLDVYKILTIQEIAGKYNDLPIPQFYRNDPIKYLGVLEDAIKSFIK